MHRAADPVWVLAAALVAGCLPIELSFSPQGSVVILREEGFCVLDRAKGTVKVLYAPKDHKPAFAAYSPSGEQVLAISQALGRRTG